ncbi:MAG: glycerol-3-phosphate 1-O-acyltransferase PlsY [Bacteroidales bacterium]|jgi:glycerol-3-phosphate acyltransferase PlsY|nr:glycerol-3-phosphate 1-O-acyltransferase PlsY [Bacteroidales bacterium]HOL99045.1 glycerol-3-phosphate 1-O-acyltransferase PlsY [Bacteroidales bacterium]HOM37436.1 glycerol-3-phosphate 1-O-acyltransferase PlsY [Bacteroidales bacterium]HPD24920.1 glycerol-3-phosphate 1-O-acyltransferase PlsY [Bacteroidales bacterium]HRT00615.1 glycerol-3-phosphate 1-O-acyltransferase PlsY [Bacteroidales bacterium]
MVIKIVLFCLVSYLIGSFSSAVWIGKWFFGIDVREHGSKNAGATNTFRVLGYKAGIPVFILDVLKSFISVNFIIFIPEIITYSEIYYGIKILFGICAVTGHIFPIYTRFKGGKGVASMLGLVIALQPTAAGITFAVFIFVFLITRIVSLSSISAAIAFPIIIYLLEKNDSLTLTIFSLIATVIIIFTHKLNIKRLIAGEEKKISFRKNKNTSL